LLERYNALAEDSDINVRPTIWKICMPKNEIHAREVSFLPTAAQGLPSFSL
jgi:hypothetical protein